MKATVKIEGLAELDAALQRLKPATGKAALRRGGIKALRPMAELAATLAPKDTGQLAGSITVSAKAVGSGAEVGKREYSAVMKSGGSKADAAKALRAARSVAKAARASGAIAAVELFMGPAKATDKDTAIKQIAQEFGTRKMEANPYMRPAWDGDKDALLARVKREMWTEIQKTVARAAKAGKLLP